MLRAEMEMSPAQVCSMFAAVLGRQERPGTDVRSLGFLGGKVLPTVFPPVINVFGMEPTTETKFYGQMTKSRSLRARDAAALVPPGGSVTRAAATRLPPSAPEVRRWNLVKSGEYSQNARFYN